MVAPLNRKTSTKETLQIIPNIDREHPYAPDDKTEEHVVMSGKSKVEICLDLLAILLSIAILFYIFYINLEPIVRIFIFAMVSLFALYKLWEIISLLIKLALGVRELLQNTKAGSVADADLRNFRQVHILIRSWRARTEERRQLMQQQRRRRY